MNDLCKLVVGLATPEPSTMTARASIERCDGCAKYLPLACWPLGSKAHDDVEAGALCNSERVALRRAERWIKRYAAADDRGRRRLLGWKWGAR